MVISCNSSSKQQTANTTAATTAANPSNTNTASDAPLGFPPANVAPADGNDGNEAGTNETAPQTPNPETTADPENEAPSAAKTSDNPLYNASAEEIFTRSLTFINRHLQRWAPVKYNVRDAWNCELQIDGDCNLIYRVVYPGRNIAILKANINDLDPSSIAVIPNRYNRKDDGAMLLIKTKNSEAKVQVGYFFHKNPGFSDAMLSWRTVDLAAFPQNQVTMHTGYRVDYDDQNSAERCSKAFYYLLSKCEEVKQK